MRSFTHSLDIAPEASDVQIAALQKLGIEGRAKLTFELSDNLRALTVEGVCSRHPDYSEEQVKLAVLRLIFSEDEFREALPGVDIEP